MAGDKAYRFRRIRPWLSRHKMLAVIPHRSGPRPDRGTRLNGFDRAGYGRHPIIENGIGWLKECRRVATWYEKLALAFLSMLKRTVIQGYFVHLHLPDTA